MTPKGWSNRFVAVCALLFGLGLAARSSGAEAPRQSPEFAAKTPDGRQMLLSKYKGKVVALVFIHTTCPHCQETTAALEKLYKELGPRGFQPLAVAFDQFATIRVLEFKTQTGATFPIAVANYEEVQSYLQDRIRYVPQIVFLDRKGVIRAQYPGESEFFRNQEQNIRKEVEALLNETAARGAKKAKPAAKPASASAGRGTR